MKNFKFGDIAYYCNEKYQVHNVIIQDSFIKNDEIYYNCIMGICNNRVIPQKMLGITKADAATLRKNKKEFLEINKRKLNKIEKELIKNKMHSLEYKNYEEAAAVIGISTKYLCDILNGVKPYTVKLAALFDKFNIGLNDTERNKK